MKTSAGMRIGVLVSSLSRNGAGVTESARGFAKNLGPKSRFRVKVLGLKERSTEQDLESWRPLQAIACKVTGPVSFGYSPPLRNLVDDSEFDLLHVHGLWM